jgi:histidine triad (HIT) family protein
MAEKTLFDKICDTEIPANIVNEDDRCVAFRESVPHRHAHVLGGRQLAWPPDWIKTTP